MIFQDAREVALQMVVQALKEELPGETLITQRAENLVAIAVEQDVPIEYLVRWIRLSVRGRHWSASEWRRWCEKYREGLRETQALQDGEKQAIEQEHL